MVILLRAGIHNDVAAPVCFAHDIGKLFFQCGQVLCGTAGERPNFILCHGYTSELIHQREPNIKSRLAKGCPREAVTDKAFQPAVDELGV